MIVLVGGLPGTGKSTLGAALGERLGAPVIARDQLEAALWRAGIDTAAGSRRAADAILRSLTEDAARHGRPIIVDSVFGTAGQRQAFTDLAAAHAEPLRRIECVCSDIGVHRSRIEGRERAIDGWYELTWADVESTRARVEPWSEERLVLDAINPFDENLAAALAALA